tara:strand:+ start:905 stop:1591 length:687 start_codon:yes stop_codon:yes gene_type:complete
MRKNSIKNFFILSLSIAFSETDYDRVYPLLLSLNSNDGWTDIKEIDDSTNISIKELSESKLYAIKVDKIIDIEPDQITDVIMDVNNYNSFFTNSESFKSEVINQYDKNLIGYQYIKVDIPFFEDREYYFKMSREQIIDQDTTTMCFWLLLEPFKEKANNINAIYLEYGAGIWKSEQISPGKYNISYRLYMDPGGSIPTFVVDIINETSIIGLFQDALNEAYRRQNTRS